MGIDVKKPRKEYEHTGYIGAAAGKPSEKISEGVNALGTKLDKIGETQPIVGTLGKQGTDSVAGAATATTGLFKGNKRMIKEGVQQIGKSALSTLTDVGGLNSMNDPGKKAQIAPTAFGGTPEAAALKTARNADGMATGMGYVDQGVAGLSGNAAMGNQLANSGLSLGASGVAGQDRALGGLLGTANTQVGSLAQAQQNMASQQLAQQMNAQAASARGGNQAAAMQGAQAQGSMNALQTNQQLGLMRLQEEQARKQDIMGAQTVAANAMGQRASLGYGTAAQGIGASTQANSNIAGVGAGINKDYLGADVAQDKAQLDADTAIAMKQAEIDAEYNKRAQAAKGGVLGFMGKAVGSYIKGGM